MKLYKDKVLQKKIALEIKRLRRIDGITQKQYFYEHSIHISRIETGNVNLTISTLKRIADSFGVTLSEFFAKAEK